MTLTIESEDLTTLVNEWFSKETKVKNFIVKNKEFTYNTEVVIGELIHTVNITIFKNGQTASETNKRFIFKV
jgi:hypothetical protein